ncbi:MAG: 5'-deoxynucleotidase [Candidatus Merdivicinus sp.]|jgi:5'-deoxynucleotidase
MLSSFFALILRMKWIERWGLMRNTFPDNLAEHSLDTAIFAHALCIIGKIRFGKQLDEERCALLALFHDAGEIITGDMPTPIKYRSEALHTLYKEVEKEAAEELIRHLPEDLQDVYRSLLTPQEADAELLPYLKAADKLSAYVKCLQEVNSGNREFEQALCGQKQAIEKLCLPEAKVFLEEFIPAFSWSLDEQQKMSMS